MAKRYNLMSDTYDVKFDTDSISLSNMNMELLRVMDNLAEKVKEGLDPENDRLAIHLDHPDLMMKSVNIPFQRPKNLKGHVIFTHIGKVLQSQESLALDGKLRLTVQIVKGVRGNGLLRLQHAKNFNDFLKRKRGIVEIKNKDGLCLPRAIAVGRAYIQFHKEKLISKNIYDRIIGVKKPEMDRQGTAARQLCTDIGLVADDYATGQKSFGMDEVKLFANLLAPRYGIAVLNSMTANSKVFETPGLVGPVHWINLLNLNEHFTPITSPSGFFCSMNWCSLCNSCYAHKTKHSCIDHCSACMTLDTDGCLFGLGRTKHCADCNRDFYGNVCFETHKNKTGKFLILFFSFFC
jgi:hypothetical protein